jgi:hypothetical protein
MSNNFQPWSEIEDDILLQELATAQLSIAKELQRKLR